MSLFENLNEDEELNEAESHLSYEEQLKLVLVKALLPVLINVAVVVAITKRDEVTRLWMRVQNYLGNVRKKDLEDTVIARFRREISEWEHKEQGR